ncbi:MAG TPA: DNA mismatch repair endonuclease MutL [Mariprofundaceae bacterium]|nr:DNA mismatch repair endonuclease MutL [Mariprofundaceae bacterium]
MTDSLIHILPPQVANQIAAGEVVERPASVVKELVENSMDAGSSRITVRIEKAGKKRIEIEDDGCGMSDADAALAMKRHATSKISSSEDLHRIASHGFRGEALPSIASVSRFRMQTALPGSSEGIEVRVNGGDPAEIRPAAPRKGTRIEILDLFLNTPARLRFMRTDKTEEAAIVEVMRGLALAHASVAMCLMLDGRKRFDLPVQSAPDRAMAIMGNEFAANSVEQTLAHEGIQLSAFLGLPTFHHRDASRMFFLLNGRVIRDKHLISALRAGYRDVMFHDRYPVAVMHIDMDPAEVDVNVHPAKREVRFTSPQTVRAAVVACVRAAIEHMGHSVSSMPAEQALRAMQGSVAGNTPAGDGYGWRGSSSAGSYQSPAYRSGPVQDIQRHLFSAPHSVHEEGAGYDMHAPLQLGHALAQIHRCFILAQTGEGVVLVDQHAAHERITYEKLKRQLAGGKLASQALLTPAPWPLAEQGQEHVLAWLHEHAAALARFGVALTLADPVQINAVPALLGGEPPVALVEELVHACMLTGLDSEGGGKDAEGSVMGMSRVLERWLGNRACKGSIKAGRLMSPEEQEALLREMERTPNIAQCNHGRPTYVRLALNDLERLFGRKE